MITKGRIIDYVYIYFCTVISLIHLGRTYSKKTKGPILSTTCPNLNFKNKDKKIKILGLLLSWSIWTNSRLQDELYRVFPAMQTPYGAHRRHSVTSTASDTVSEAVSVVRRRVVNYTIFKDTLGDWIPTEAFSFCLLSLHLTKTAFVLKPNCSGYPHISFFPFGSVGNSIHF